MPAATPSAGSPPRHAVVDRALQYRLSLSPAAADPSETPPTRQQLDAELDLLAERDPRFKKMVAVNRVLTQPMERSEQEEAILHHVKANLDSCISSVDSGGGSSSVYDGQRSNRAGAAAAADLRRWQVLSSLIYYACIWFLGLQSGIIGPTLAGVADQLGEASGTALAAQFSFRSGGFLIGTLSVGAIFEASTKQHSTIALAAAGLALGLAVLPTVRDLQLYYLLWVPMGACMGYVDTGTNLLIMETWKGANAVPWMNLLHFMWGVGSFMAPLQLTFVSVASSYRIVAAAGACAALLPLLLPSPATRHPISVAERADRRRKRSQSKAGGGSGGAGVGEEKEKLWLLETTAAFGIFCFYVGLEAGYGAWLATFLVELEVTDEEGAALATSLYWASLTAGRLMAVPLAVFVAPAKLIAIDLVGACLACAAFTVGPRSHEAMLFIAVAIVPEK